MRKLVRPHPDKINLLFEVIADLNRKEEKRAKDKGKQPDLWTQQRLSQESKISFAQINTYYLGKREPSLDTLMRIATALKISPRELIPKEPPKAS